MYIRYIKLSTENSISKTSKLTKSMQELIKHLVDYKTGNGRITEINDQNYVFQTENQDE